MWVPPAGWQEFLTNMNALRGFDIRAKNGSYAAAINGLLVSGNQILAMRQHQQTVDDNVLEQWLYAAEILAERMHNETMAATSRAGQSAPRGFMADVDRFYDSATGSSVLENLDRYIYGGQESGQGGEGIHPYHPSLIEEGEDLAKLAILGIAGIVLLPPILNYMKGRRK